MSETFVQVLIVGYVLVLVMSQSLCAGGGKGALVAFVLGEPIDFIHLKYKKKEKWNK